MKFASTMTALVSLPLLIVSCTVPLAQGGSAGGTYQDPNNPYAVPGVTTQGGYAPAAQTPYQAPANEAPYQAIPSTSANPPASIPSYTPSASPAPVASGGGGRHTVTGGDTLWGLSRKYNVSVDEIRQANSLSGDTIITGQTLNIPR